MVWRQSTDELLDTATKTVETGTNTKSIDPVFLLNMEKKKVPHNIQIQNNKKEPKIKSSIKYSAKQNYRKYKTKKEPILRNKITINEEDDIVTKIQEAFGLKDKKNTNFSQVETANADYIKIPSNATQETPSDNENLKLKAYYDDIDEIPIKEKEDISGMEYTDDFKENLSRYMYDIADDPDIQQFFDFDHENKMVSPKRNILSREENSKIQEITNIFATSRNLDHRQLGNELHRVYNEIANIRRRAGTNYLDLVVSPPRPSMPSPSAPSYPSTPTSRISNDDENYLNYMDRFHNRFLHPVVPRDLRFLEREDSALIPFEPIRFRGRPPIRPEAVSKRALQQIQGHKRMNKFLDPVNYNVKQYNALFDTELQKYLNK